MSEAEEVKGTDEDNSPLEDDKPIGSSSDLEQEKQRRAQDFYAQGNIGTTQVFINSLGSMNWDSQRKQAPEARPTLNQTYQLHIRADCAKFVEQYKNSEHLAVAIVLSAFELVRLSDLSELKDSLMGELPAADPAREDDVAVVRDPYISVDTFLSAIGGEWFTNQDGQQCVGLGEDHSQQAMQNLWELFPSLRDPICRWLIHIYQVYKFRTAFDAYQIVCAFTRVISLDFEDAQKRIFSRLFSQCEYEILLGNIMCKLYEDIALRKKLDRMLLNWLAPKSDWLWRPACLACSFLMPKMELEQLSAPLEKAVKRRLIRLTRGDSAFLAVLLSQSSYFRIMLAGLLGKAVQQADRQAGRLTSIQSYLYLIRSCYYIVDAHHPELPLVACDTLEQQRCLTPILRETISQTSLRKQLYAILRAYLEELSRYQCTPALFDHLCAYFYNMAQSAPEYWPDILQFLNRCKGKLPQQIYERLYPLYCPAQQLPSTL